MAAYRIGKLLGELRADFGQDAKLYKSENPKSADISDAVKLFKGIEGILNVYLNHPALQPLKLGKDLSKLGGKLVRLEIGDSRETSEPVLAGKEKKARKKKS